MTEVEKAMVERVKPQVLELLNTKHGLYNANEPRLFKRLFSDDRGGYITVAPDTDGLSFMWTNGKDEHLRAGRPALCIFLSRTTGINCYMSSAITFHIRWGYGRGGLTELENAVTYLNWLHGKLVNTGLRPI